MYKEFIMAKIISSILIAILGYILTGYDFFILSALITYSIDIYEGLLKIHKILQKYTNDKTVDNQAS